MVCLRANNYIKIMNKKYFIFFGPPGSGKGTQAEMLDKRLKLVYISTGSLLRKEVHSGSALGRKVRPILKDGRLVGNKIIEKIVKDRLEKRDAFAGAIFDGFPRNKEQQEFLKRLLKELHFDEKKDKIYAIQVDVGDKEVKHRITRRRSCVCGQVYHLDYNPPKIEGKCNKCGKALFTREDDKADVIEHRLKIYHKRSQPLIKYWHDLGKLITVNGERKPKAIQISLVKKLKKLKAI